METQRQETTQPKSVSLPKKALGYLSVVIGAAALQSCAGLDPYGYYPQQGYGQTPPPARQVYNQRPNYNMPQQDYYQGRQQDYQGVQQQTQMLQHEAQRLAMYNSAINATAQAIRAGIPTQLQNQNTYRMTMLQAQATTPRGLSTQDYQNYIQLKNAQANLARQRVNLYNY